MNEQTLVAQSAAIRSMYLHQSSPYLLELKVQDSYETKVESATALEMSGYSRPDRQCKKEDGVCSERIEQPDVGAKQTSFEG